MMNNGMREQYPLMAGFLFEKASSQSNVQT
jgi:hypothetical protein